MTQTTSHQYACSICLEGSHLLCAWCAKDACDDHYCTRCHRCSDCCQCGVPLEATAEGETAGE
jgi:hypothetical protein